MLFWNDLEQLLPWGFLLLPNDESKILKDLGVGLNMPFLCLLVVFVRLEFGYQVCVFLKVETGCSFLMSYVVLLDKVRGWC